MLERPLVRRRVLELPGCTAGSYAGRLLAAIGAEVVVVEINGKIAPAEWRAFYHAGKKSVLVAEERAAGREIEGMTDVADIVLAPTGSRPGRSGNEWSGGWVTEEPIGMHPIEVAFEGAVMALRALAEQDGNGCSCSGQTVAEAPARAATAVDHDGGFWPEGVYHASDGWVVAGPGPHSVETVERLIASQIEGERSEADSAIEQWASQHGRYELFHTAQLWRLAFTPVLTFREAAEDPHFVESGAFLSCTGASRPLPRPPFDWPGMPPLSGPPVPGADNEVFVEWGVVSGEGAKSLERSRSADRVNS